MEGSAACSPCSAFVLLLMVLMHIIRRQIIAQNTDGMMTYECTHLLLLDVRGGVLVQLEHLCTHQCLGSSVSNNREGQHSICPEDL
jgi:hypothetical protein